MSLSSPFIRTPCHDDAAQPVDRARGCGCVHDAAGVAAAAGGLPGDHGHAPASPAPAPRRWRRRWRRRSSGRSAPSPGSTRSRSMSSQGSTRINIQFDLGKDINAAAREVQAAINASRSLLPSAMPGMPSYRKMNPSQAPIMILALTSKTKTPSEIYDLASTVLAQKVAQVTGVGDVTVGGGSLPAVRVELEPNALTQYGISLDDVRQAIIGANLLRPKGVVEDGPQSWQVQASDQLAKAADYRPLIIRYRDGAAGAPLGRCARARRRRGPIQHGLLQQRSGHPAGDQPSARRQHHQDGRCDPPAAANPSGVPARRRRPQHRERSVAQHPCHAARCGAHAAHRRGARDSRRAGVPRQRASGCHPCRRRAHCARRQLRRHVPVGVLPQQPVAHGADRRHRPRRGRRNRGAREHLASRRDGEAPFRGGARRGTGGRVHVALDESGPRRGVRVDSVHGRDRRALVPRVLDYARGRNHDLAVRVAHPHPDAVRALARATPARAAEPIAARERGGVRTAAARVRPHASDGRSGTLRSSSVSCSG